MTLMKRLVRINIYTRSAPRPLPLNCVICNIRKPRRHCPGVKGEICSICCGTEREQSVDCPLDCVFLNDAHAHERLPELDPSSVPNQDIEVTEEFLKGNEVLLALIAVALHEGAMKTQGVTDWDVREALDSLIKTYRTLQSGIVYESVPQNQFAAAITVSVRESLADIVRRETEATGKTTLRDSSVLGVLVFMQRLEYSRNNGRKRSRSFLDFLRGFYIPAEEESVIAEPDEPLIIL